MERRSRGIFTPFRSALLFLWGWGLKVLGWHTVNGLLDEGFYIFF